MNGRERIGMVLAAGLLAVAGCGGGSSKGKPTPCSDDSTCGRGFICEANVCAQVDCTLDEALCGAGDRVCVAIPEPGFDPAKKYCTHIECTDAIPCSDAAKDCKDNLCIPKATPETTPDAETVVDTAPAETADTGGSDTGGSDTPPPPPGVDCKPCTNQGDCGEGAACAPVAGNKYCLRECAADADCKGGYICYQVISPGPKHCLPVSYKCVPCASQGCEAGKCCDLITGDCNACEGECAKCTYDFECSPGYRCYKKQGNPTGVCVAECGQSGTCADLSKFTCGDNGKGVQVCIPKDDQVCQSCPSDKPFTLPDGTCVQCLNSTHCPQTGYCDQTTHTCTDQGCPSGTYKCQDGNCHQCCTDAHCAGLPPPATGKCVNYQCEGAQDPCGNTCAVPYPVCANVGGTWQCVQCATDADCSAVPNCKCGNYICVDNSTGQVCSTQSTCGVSCNDSSECPPGQNGETLTCNTQFHVCFKAGGCDGATACCGPGQQCVDLLMLLFGGGMGLPGMPPGTGTGMGYCSCNTQADCLGGEPCTPMGILCAIPLIGTIICPGGSLPPTVPQNMCFDISQLLGGLGI